MLRLLKNQNPFSVIILFIFTVLIKLKVLIHPESPVYLKRHFMYNYIVSGCSHVFIRSPFAYTLLAIIILFIQAIYLNSITVRHKLFPRNTYVPAFVYLLLTSIYPDFSVFNETLFITWLLLAALDIMFSFSQTNDPRKQIFNAALLVSLACIFQSTLLLFFVLLILAMVLFRPFNTGEWAVALMGYITPLYFMVALLYFFDKTYLLHTWLHIGFSIVPLKTSALYFAITLSGIVLLFSSGVFAMAKNVSLGNIYVRRNWIALSFYLIIAIMVAFVTDKTVKSAWLVTIAPLSIVVSHALALEKNKRFSNFMFYFSLAFLIFCIVANK